MGRWANGSNERGVSEYDDNIGGNSKENDVQSQEEEDYQDHGAEPGKEIISRRCPSTAFNASTFSVDLEKGGADPGESSDGAEGGDEGERTSSSGDDNSIYMLTTYHLRRERGEGGDGDGEESSEEDERREEIDHRYFTPSGKKGI